MSGERTRKPQRDQVAAGTHFNASKTHCPKGHPYDADNTYVGKRPGRSTNYRNCAKCALARQAQRRQERREARRP